MTNEEIRIEVEEFLRHENHKIAPPSFKEKIAYLLGIEIECNVSLGSTNWKTIVNPMFKEDPCNYRIKPKETYRPFTYEDVKNMEWDKWVIIEKSNSSPMFLNGISKLGFLYSISGYSTYEYALENWTINEKPCGVKI